MSSVFTQYKNQWTETIDNITFDNIIVNKKEFHKSKQPINFDLANVDQIVISGKFKNSDY